MREFFRKLLFERKRFKVGDRVCVSNWGTARPLHHADVGETGTVIASLSQGDYSVKLDRGLIQIINRSELMKEPYKSI